MTKAVIFDASTVINFVMNGLLPEFRKLRENFRGKFLITSEVKSEIVDKPINIKRFELEALKIQELINDGILEMPSSMGIDGREIRKMTNDFLETANMTFYSHKRNIKIIHPGEASCLALSRILSAKKIKNVLAVDERTTKLLIENPGRLKKILMKKLHRKIDVNRENFGTFRGFKIIRSPELVYVIWKKNLSRLKGKKVLDAMLYAVKFKGAAVSGEEIREIKRMA